MCIRDRHYIVETSRKAIASGAPLLQALIFHHPEDKLCLHIDDEYYFGNDFLVAPVMNSENRRDVYLPEGKWVNFFTGERLEGEMCIRDRDLVYKILDEQAIVGATQKVAAEKANESQPRKRSRINVKKDGDKVYTATKDKAQKLEANTPQPAAAAAETVKETAPVAVTPQTEAVAETSAEEKTPKKRGRKPGSKKVTAKTEEQLSLIHI